MRFIGYALLFFVGLVVFGVIVAFSFVSLGAIFSMIPIAIGLVIFLVVLGWTQRIEERIGERRAEKREAERVREAKKKETPTVFGA